MPACQQTLPAIRLAAAVTATLLLAGCVVGPDYVRPASTLPEHYPTVGTESRATAPVNPEWWTLFNDATLNQLVDQALAANQDS